MPVVQQIKDTNEIKIHLQEVSALRLPMHGTIQGGHMLSNCRLIYNAAEDEAPRVKIPQGTLPLKGRITLSYTTIHSPFTFSSVIDAGQRLDPQHTLITIRMPGSVKQFNRRKYLRINPAPDAPVHLDLDLPIPEPVFPEVEDISSGGVAFIVPSRQAYFDIGKQYPARLHIPGIGKINSHIASRNLKKMFNMFRVGAEFINISDEHRKLIEAYTIKLNSKASGDTQEAGFNGNPRVLVLDEPEHASRYGFLEGRCQLEKAPPASAMDAACSHQPELVVLNLDFPESAAAFMAAKDHEALKGRPMILVSSRERELFFQIPEWQFMSIPFSEALFMEKAQQLVSDFWRSNSLEMKRAALLAERRLVILDLTRSLDFKAMEHLKAHHYKISVIYHTKNILKQIVEKEPQIILINTTDTHLLRDICRLMKFNKTLRNTPKVLLHDNDNGAEELVVQELITEAVAKPVGPGEVVSRLRPYR